MIFTAESVTRGHPDKVADQISDAILDEHLRHDPAAHVAVETLVKGGTVVLAGEVSSKAPLTWNRNLMVARETLEAIGYDSNSKVVDMIGVQSPEINNAVSGVELGAGDQGIMYGFATDETPERLPQAQVLARDLTDELTRLRETGVVPWLHPDGKAQVTVDGPSSVSHVVVSACHSDGVSFAEVQDALEDLVIRVLQRRDIDVSHAVVSLNPAGPWTLGGPEADAGVTGRKLMVDTYGGLALHGGGAFSGKDPSKVDRSAAYAARQAAKWLVDTGQASDAQVALAYAIGQADPLMVRVTANSDYDEWRLEKRLSSQFDFRPSAIIERLDLQRPIYLETAARGHFGRPHYSWERV